MTNGEAKLYLHTLRQGDQESDDPRVAEALAQTRQDAELRAWFESQQALDYAIARRLQELPTPPGLAEQIVSQRRIRIHRRRFLTRALALAALLVALFAVGVLLFTRLQPSSTEYAALRRGMAELLETFPRFDLATNDWTAVSQWLAAKPGYSAAPLPGGLEQYRSLGCQEIEWRGRHLMLVCFIAEGQVVHLLVALASDWPGAPEAAPALTRTTGWSTAGWTAGDHTYLILTRGDPQFLENLVTEALG